MNRTVEYLHSWYVLIITAATLGFLFFSHTLWINILITLVVLFIFLHNGLEMKRVLKILSYAFVFSFSIFLLSVLNPAKAERVGLEYRFLNSIFYQNSVEKALLTMMKLFFVSFVSLSSVSAIDYTKVILHLIVQKGLRPFWGYPLLLAINSITLFKDEYERIKLNTRLRGLPLKDRVLIFFPLLVFAIRHSQRGALSLVTRGLNDKKSFYFTYELSRVDKKRFFIFWVFYFGLVIMMRMKLR